MLLREGAARNGRPVGISPQWRMQLLAIDKREAAGLRFQACDLTLGTEPAPGSWCRRSGTFKPLPAATSQPVLDGEGLVHHSAPHLDRDRSPAHLSSKGEAAAAGPSPMDADDRTAPHTRLPEPKMLRDRLHAIAADVTAAWRAESLPEAVANRTGLQAAAEDVVRRAGGREEHVGWTMVALVTAYWRDRLAEPGGRRLLLLPDCGQAAVKTGTPATCGPQCVYATLAAAASESGWQVASTRDAAAAIAGMLGGLYDGVLGVASLEDLEKAFSLLPPFTMPIAAVPVNAQTGLGLHERPGNCPVGQVDAEWVLGLLGVAGGSVSPVADHLPLLRESAEMFTRESLAELFTSVGVENAAAACLCSSETPSAAAATGVLGIEFLAKGGKFLRPFMALAAYNAVTADIQTGNVVPAYAAAEPRLASAAATAIEVFHKASLVHDDIEDDDAMRYGRPTMHREFGVPTAINTGDYLVGLGYRLIGGLEHLTDGEVDPRLQRDLLAILSRAHLELARGQGGELWWRDAAEKRLTTGEALEIYGLKTSPAFAAAVEMGIRLAGCDPRQAGAVEAYALHVGTAFQVLNDLKDWHGDLENLRVEAGDLLGGRPTVLWATAMEQLSEVDQQRLLQLSQTAGNADPEQQGLRLVEAKQLYEKAGVFVAAQEMVSEHRRQALHAAATCRLPRLREVLEFLLDLAAPEQGGQPTAEAP